MTIKFDVYAIMLTEKNIPQIIEATRPLGWCLTYLQDNLEYNAEEFSLDTILFMKVYHDTTEIATFTDEARDGLSSPYRLTDELDPKFGIFYKVENI